jgi:hypothetical protein
MVSSPSFSTLPSHILQSVGEEDNLDNLDKKYDRGNLTLPVFQTNGEISQLRSCPSLAL